MCIRDRVSTQSTWGNKNFLKMRSGTRKFDHQADSRLPDEREVCSPMRQGYLDKQPQSPNSIEKPSFGTQAKRGDDNVDDRKTLYIRNLKDTMTKTMLYLNLSKYGDIVGMTFKAHDNPGDSKVTHWAIVEMDKPEQARTVLDNRHNPQLLEMFAPGKKVYIDYKSNEKRNNFVSPAPNSRPTTSTPQSGSQTRESREEEDKKVLYFRNLRPTLTESDLEKVLSGYGTVNRITLKPFRGSHACKYAVVEMENGKQAKEILTSTAEDIRSLFLEGKELYIRYHQSNEERHSRNPSPASGYQPQKFNSSTHTVPKPQAWPFQDILPPKVLTLDYAKQNWRGFKALPSEKRRSCYQEWLYPLIEKQIGPRLAKRISVMITDFEVMTDEEILQCIEIEQALKQRVGECKEALGEDD
eukprot:TRINITY_DN1183_c0_g1_i1.p1 TRINITY_DN1183_c0_g1~~TRINITY_DN1183_c0_g1_i1.p1  ORF type:complete len:412 (-),score=64.38 TRINITY_DN1183_c0_g1_i1:590-1825(-)